MSGWAHLRRRHRLMEAVLDDIALRADPAIPSGLLAELEAEFGGLEAFLLAVQYRWYNHFNARLDMLLEDEPADLPAAVAALWDWMARAQWPSRLLLDAHADHPALVAGDDHHRRRLLLASGVDQDRLGESGARSTAIR
jgi:hypothetical protein